MGTDYFQLKVMKLVSTCHHLNDGKVFIMPPPLMDMRKKPLTTFWENALQEFWIECLFLDHTYWSSKVKRISLIRFVGTTKRF